MSRIRVLVVDDAVVMRKLISDVLGGEADIEVVGVAAHGKLALARIPQLNPDCITLDVEMPEMDGIETVGEIRKAWPKLPVIMFSTVTERGAVRTLDALARGATDYVTKPANVGNFNEAINRLKQELVPKIRVHCGRVPPVAMPEVPKPAGPPVALAKPRTHGPVRALSIGTSTGGPNALAEVMAKLPKIGVPVFIVQHMPPLFTAMLAQRLNEISKIEVCEAVQGQDVRPDCAYIAPGGKHMEVRPAGVKLKIELHEGPPENSCRPAVDVLFRSVAAAYGNSALAVVMTGMGHDGLRGCEKIAEAGGQVIVQDERTSVVWGMPGTVASAGLAEQVLPLDQIAAAIESRIPRPARLAGGR